MTGSPGSEPHEYCVVHDQPLDWCGSRAARCREIMKGWGLYPEEAETAGEPAADEPGSARA
jgi:hypothetical protein